MLKKIGIRREDKNIWEKRVPLTPMDIQMLSKTEKLSFTIQPSKIRVFKDSEYKNFGANISEDLSKSDIIFAVKEIPATLIKNNKVYVFFSHTIKGQSHNMPMLKKIIESGSTLIDYEKIVDASDKRLIFFGEHAGLAGMIDTLWAFGQRFKWEGINNPFSKIKQAYKYKNLAEANKAISQVGNVIKRNGLNKKIAPLVIGIAGYGNVSRGAQRILDNLPITEIEPNEIHLLFKTKKISNKTIYKVVFREEHTVKPIKNSYKFDLCDFFKNPQKYRSRFEQYIPFLSILVNCIYWDKRYPRLITKDQIRKLYNKKDGARLRVVGDISCDVTGAVEFTVKTTNPSQPVFVYDVQKDKAIDGVVGNGPVVLAVDNLPCELSREASIDFSGVLKTFVSQIADANYSIPFKNIKLPPEIKRAVIVYQGKLTPDYKYLSKYLK